VDQPRQHQHREKQLGNGRVKVLNKMRVEQSPTFRYWYVLDHLGGNDINKEGVKYLVEIYMKKLQTLNMCNTFLRKGETV
jgi:hypothetical protein